MTSGQFRFDEIEAFFEYRNGYPRPDWDRLHEWIDARSTDADRQHMWIEVQAKWLGLISDHLQDSYSIWESSNFLVVSNRQKPECEHLIRFCEKSRTHILRLLRNAASEQPWGKIIVLVLSDSDDYFDYIGEWYPDEGEFGGSIGACLSGPCPHIAVLAGPRASCEPTIAHELNHLFLQHLDLPRWLDEGLTQIIEHEIAGLGKPERDREMSRKHGVWWNSETIQEFWSGTSFFASDDRQLMSYDLAMQMAGSLLLKFPSTFADFLTSATSSDAGDAAIWTTCRYSLNQCVAEILGNQDWTPKLQDIASE